MKESVKYRIEVGAINENVWSSNALEFDSVEDAKAYLDDLGSRWFGFNISRVVTVDTPPRQTVDLNDPNIYKNWR